MGHFHKGTPSKTAGSATPVLAKPTTASDPLRKPARYRPRAAAKHEDPTSPDEPYNMIGAGAMLLAEPEDFDYASREQDLMDAEAEIARLLGKV